MLFEYREINWCCFLDEKGLGFCDLNICVMDTASFTHRDTGTHLRKRTSEGGVTYCTHLVKTH